MQTQPQQQSYKGSFHFVVKDASNLNVRNPEEAFSISSHVTNKYYRWAKRNKSATPPRSHTGSPSDNESGRRSHSLDHQQQLTATTTTTGRSSRVARPSARKCPAPDGPAMQTICWQLGSGSSTGLGQGQGSRGCGVVGGDSASSSPEALGLDDFLTKSEDEDSDDFGDDDSDYLMGGPLQSHIDLAMPSAAIKACSQLQRIAYEGLYGIFMSSAPPARGNTLKLQTTRQMVHERIKGVFKDDKCIHGWYAAVITMRAYFVDPRDYTRLWPMALKHQNRSLTLLREELLSGNAPTESLLMCIWAICCVGFFAGDTSQNHNHAVATRKIVDDLGGLAALSDHVRINVLAGDYIHAAFNLTRPYYHYSLYDPGSFDTQVAFEQFKPLMPASDFHFQRWDEAFLIDNDDLSNQLSIFLNMHREVMAAAVLAEKLYEEKQEAVADEVFVWMHRRRAALRSWCMSLYCDLAESMNANTRMSRAVRRQLQASITLAISYSLSFITGFAGPQPKWLLYIPVHHLRPQLETLLDYMSKRATSASSMSNPNGVSHHECLLWLFFVGACAEQVSDEAGKRPVTDPLWHSTRFVDMTQMLGLRTWKEAQKILKRFLYQETVMDRFVEGLFEQRTQLLRFGSPLRTP